MRCPDFLLFIPTHAPGLKAIFSYYTQTVKLTAEGDVHLSDEALSGLGTTFQFLSTSLFGAITQIYDTHARIPHHSHPTHITRPPEPETEVEVELQLSKHEDTITVFEDDDPHLPINPARRKDAATVTPLDPASLPLDYGGRFHQIMAKLTDTLPSTGYFAAGGLAGITSRTITAPLDRLKVYLIAQTGDASEALAAAKKGAPVQATKAGMSTMWKACKDIWAGGGIRSLFAGTSQCCVLIEMSKLTCCRQRAECYKGYARVRCQVRLLRGTISCIMHYMAPQQ